MTAVDTAVTPVPYGRRVRDLALADPDGIGLWFVPLVGPEQSVTWAELDRRSTQIGRAVADLGVVIGDRVGVELRNSPEMVEVVLALWKLGAVPVPMRWDLPEWERQRVVEVLAGRLCVRAADLDLIEESRSLPEEPLPEVVPPQANGICSSGSTGTPKVIIADRPGVWDPVGSAPFPSSWGEIARPQVVLVPAPLYHTNGFSSLLSLLGGDTLVVLEKFDAERALDAIERHRVTTFTATPTMLQRMARVADIAERDLSSLVWILQGAAVMPPSLARFWIDLVGPERFFMAYGMTEALGLAAMRGDEYLDHPGSVGRGYRETEIRILGPDLQELPPGETGEIYLRSPSSGMYEYLGQTKKLFTTEDGFGTAGDMGYLDTDGYLYIVDRRVDMIISGGANVYPAEVENALIEHPGIADVVVIGLADEEWGRRVHAIIEPTDHTSPPSQAEVIAFAKARLARYKVPKTVEAVDAIPRSEATKVSRSALVDERGG